MRPQLQRALREPELRTSELWVREFLYLHRRLYIVSVRPGSVLDFIVSSSHPTVAFLSINFKGEILRNMPGVGRIIGSDRRASNLAHLIISHAQVAMLISWSFEVQPFVISPTWNLNRWKLKKDFSILTHLSRFTGPRSFSRMTKDRRTEGVRPIRGDALLHISC